MFRDMYNLYRYDSFLLKLETQASFILISKFLPTLPTKIPGGKKYLESDLMNIPLLSNRLKVAYLHFHRLH